MPVIILIISTFIASVHNQAGTYPVTCNSDIPIIYEECHLQNLLSIDIFSLAMTGMERIQELKNKKIITIIDYSKPSTQERFFVIDLESKRILYKSLVAHGKYSGDNMAKKFSNTPESLKSCIGFFVTAETYNGRHGYSLRLDGLEPGYNDNARERAIVIHGASYVSAGIAREYGQLGKSWGCPALPSRISKEIIDLIAKGSCLFVYGKDPEYLKSSKILNQE